MFRVVLSCVACPASLGSLVLGLASCGGLLAPVPDNTGDAAFPASAPMGPCAAVEQEHPIEGRTHVPVCSFVQYETKPPSSGNHYPIWAAFQTYTSPVPEGFWVHDLEHGTIVLSYNCPNGCDADVAAAQQMLDALPADPLCDGTGVSRRSIMTPDPNLDVPFAASAWGWTLRAKCFDPVAFQAFDLDHYGQGPEALCAQGDPNPWCNDP